MERILRGVQSFNTAWTGSLLRKFVDQTWALESMPAGLYGTCYVLTKLDKYHVKTLVAEDGEAVMRCLQDVRCMER
jgi:hypothetical protein